MIWAAIGFLAALTVLVWVLFRASERAAQAEQAQDDAEAALATTRRIEDATRDPLPPSDARGWLRDFGRPPDDQR